MSVKKILIIDDEPDVVRYLTLVLKDHGYETFSASSVDEAEQILKQLKPDLICLDIMMPMKLGMSLYQTLKTDHRYLRIPVVIVSGIRDEKDFDFREFIPDQSIPEPDAFVEKPIKVNQFVQVVQNLIE